MARGRRAEWKELRGRVEGTVQGSGTAVESGGYETTSLLPILTENALNPYHELTVKVAPLATQILVKAQD